MNNRTISAIALIVLILGVAFYWYEYKPKQVKERCSTDARFNTNTISEDDTGRRQFIGNYREDCSIRPGLIGEESQQVISENKNANVDVSLSSKEYAAMGKQVWSAFSCAAWASKTDQPGEAERLFTFGYEQGKRFLEALRAKKIEQTDISQEVPIGVTLLLEGPSDEFILGRIYSSVEEDALSEVFKTGNELNSEGWQKIIAQNKFRDGNCQLIGK